MTATNKPANARQEGGSHYRGTKIQHWDLAVMYRWDFFQYQITKYVMRWRDKHKTSEAKLVDLRKARHFLDKYIEEVEAGRIGAAGFNDPNPFEEPPAAPDPLWGSEPGRTYIDPDADKPSSGQTRS